MLSTGPPCTQFWLPAPGTSVPWGEMESDRKRGYQRWNPCLCFLGNGFQRDTRDPTGYSDKTSGRKRGEGRGLTPVDNTMNWLLLFTLGSHMSGKILPLLGTTPLNLQFSQVKPKGWSKAKHSYPENRTMWLSWGQIKYHVVPES